MSYKENGQLALKENLKNKDKYKYSQKYQSFILNRSREIQVPIHITYLHLLKPGRQTNRQNVFT